MWKSNLVLKKNVFRYIRRKPEECFGAEYYAWNGDLAVNIRCWYSITLRMISGLSSLITRGALLRKRHPDRYVSGNIIGTARSLSQRWQCHHTFDVILAISSLKGNVAQYTFCDMRSDKWRSDGSDNWVGASLNVSVLVRSVLTLLFSYCGSY